MKEEIRQEILHDLTTALRILQTREDQDIEQLRELSDHAIEDIAVQKDLELVSVTVLLYSIYKVFTSFTNEQYKDLVKQLGVATKALDAQNLGAYNRCLKILYEIVTKSNAKVQEHLQDVMQAARIKKGASLLQRGLSIGQAAGIMGLSNWDLQQYAGKTVMLAQHDEKMPAKKRLQTAFRLFGVS